MALEPKIKGRQNAGQKFDKLVSLVYNYNTGFKYFYI